MRNPPLSFSAVVLAGGQSRRMGRPKAWLPFGQGTLLARQLTVLSQAGATDLMVAARPGQSLPEPPPGMKVRRVEDSWPDAGPLAGIERALREARCDWLVVLGVDLPAIPDWWIRKLVDRCHDRTGSVPRRDGRWEPLAAAYPVRAAASEARFRLAGGRLRLQDWVASGVAGGWLEDWEASGDAPPLLANCNQPGDWPPQSVPPTGDW